MAEDYDDHAGKPTGYKWSDDVALLHTRYEDDHRVLPEKISEKFSGLNEKENPDE
jgi:hypothetical protein